MSFQGCVTIPTPSVQERWVVLWMDSASLWSAMDRSAPRLNNASAAQLVRVNLLCLDGVQLCSLVTYFVFVRHSWWDRRNCERDVISAIVKPVSPRMHIKNEEPNSERRVHAPQGEWRRWVGWAMRTLESPTKNFEVRHLKNFPSHFRIRN